MAEYVDPKGGSFSESQGKKNPFLIVQSVSRSPVGKHSPMKDFGIFSIPAAIAAIAKAAAATKVGTAVVGAAKAIGTKLAATKVGGAVVKAAKFVGKGIKAIKGTKVVKGITKGVKAVKKFTGKITGKANIGAQKGGEKAITETATKTATKTGGEVTKTVAKEGFTAPKQTLTQKLMSGSKKRLGEEMKIESLAQRGVSSLQEEDARSEQVAAGHRQRAAGHYANLPTFGSSGSNVPPTNGDGEESELGSVLAYKTPFKLRSGNSPLFKRMGSPFKGAKGKAAFDAALGTYSEQTKEYARGSGYGLDPTTFKKAEGEKQFKYL